MFVIFLVSLNLFHLTPLFLLICDLFLILRILADPVLILWLFCDKVSILGLQITYFISYCPFHYLVGYGMDGQLRIWLMQKSLCLMCPEFIDNHSWILPAMKTTSKFYFTNLGWLICKWSVSKSIQILKIQRTGFDEEVLEKYLAWPPCSKLIFSLSS